MVELERIAKKLVESGKGILAADESTGTAGKRLAQISMENTEDNRRAMREMFFRTPGLKQNISGVILYDETLRQKAEDGTLFRNLLKEQGIECGIKVDLGLTDFTEGAEGEQQTQGLNSLDERLADYADLGATFAKWREVYKVSESLPSVAHIEASAQRLAKYAKLCQKHNIVPIVEPEVLMDGAHSIERCAEVTAKVLTFVFASLKAEAVMLEGMILKPNMVIHGKNGEKRPVQEIADKTIEILKKNVPAQVAGIAFLSGGQTPDEATDHLWAMNMQDTPWPLTYSFGHALQQEALTCWGGKDENVSKAQAVFALRAEKCGMATYGKS